MIEEGCIRESTRREMLDKKAAAKRQKLSKLETLKKKAHQEKHRRADMKYALSKENYQGKKDDKPAISTSSVTVDMTPKLLKLSGVSVIQRQHCSYDKRKLKGEYSVRLYDGDHREQELWIGNGIKISREKESSMDNRLLNS